MCKTLFEKQVIHEQENLFLSMYLKFYLNTCQNLLNLLQLTTKCNNKEHTVNHRQNTDAIASCITHN